jgi:hypothetical protein
VPDLGLKLHDRRPERILTGDLDVDEVCGSFIWGVRWPVELAPQMCEVLAIARWLDDDLGVLVVVDVGDLLRDAPGAVGGHDGCVRMGGERGWWRKAESTAIGAGSRRYKLYAKCCQPEAPRSDPGSTVSSCGEDESIRIRGRYFGDSRGEAVLRGPGYQNLRNSVHLQTVVAITQEYLVTRVGSFERVAHRRG